MPNNSLVGQYYFDASHFASDTHNFEVQRTNHFEIVLNFEKLNLEGKSQLYSDHIRMSAISVSQPKVSSDALELKHGNDTVKVAQRPTYDDITITIYDTLGRDQIQVVQAWFDKVFDHKTKLMGLVSDYKTDGTLYMYSPNCQIVRKWHLQGIWPRSFGMGNDFSFDSSDAQTISLELSVDRYWEDSETN